MGVCASNHSRFCVSEFLRKRNSIDGHKCGVVWCGVVWCGVVWCGVVWCEKKQTLCLRYPGDRPGWRVVVGSRRITPSPPSSMVSWKNFSKWGNPLHSSFSATRMHLFGVAPNLSTKKEILTCAVYGQALPRSWYLSLYVLPWWLGMSKTINLNFVQSIEFQ